MPAYDYFYRGKPGAITVIGRSLVDRKNDFFLELISRLVAKRPFTLLEIGPGHGYFADHCRRFGISYKALEANHTMAQRLVEQGYAVAEAWVPPIALHESFDTIFMDQVFEHMTGVEQAINMVQTCLDHLQSDGLLVISSPDILAIKEDFFVDYTHNYPTCIPRLRGLFTDFGLDILYEGHIAASVRGYWTSRLIAFAVRMAYSIGLFHLLFRKKADQAKFSLLPSCIIVGRRR